MKYRAVAVGIKDESDRPIQAFFTTEDRANDWAVKIAEKHAVPVAIWITEDRLVATVQPKGAA